MLDALARCRLVILITFIQSFYKSHFCFFSLPFHSHLPLNLCMHIQANTPINKNPTNLKIAHNIMTVLTSLVSDKRVVCSVMPSNPKSVRVCLYRTKLLSAQSEINLVLQQTCFKLKTTDDGCFSNSDIQVTLTLVTGVRLKRQIRMFEEDNKLLNSYARVACVSQEQFTCVHQCRMIIRSPHRAPSV